MGVLTLQCLIGFAQNSPGIIGKWFFDPLTMADYQYFVHITPDSIKVRSFEKFSQEFAPETPGVKVVSIKYDDRNQVRICVQMKRRGDFRTYYDVIYFRDLSTNKVTSYNKPHYYKTKAEALKPQELPSDVSIQPTPYCYLF